VALHPTPLNFLIYEENFGFFFISVAPGPFRAWFNIKRGPDFKGLGIYYVKTAKNLPIKKKTACQTSYAKSGLFAFETIESTG
jgi:hypothetical protein